MEDSLQKFRDVCLAALKAEGAPSRAAVARACNISRSYMTDLLKGRTKGRESVRRCVAAQLGFDYEDAMRGNFKVSDTVEFQCPAWARELMPRVARLKAAEQTMLRKQLEATLEMLEEVRGPTRKTKRSGAK